LTVHQYGSQLSHFLDFFPREHVRIYLYESFRANTRSMLRDIQAFLGVNPDQPIDVSHRHNETMTLRYPAIENVRWRIPGTVPLTG
jgi:hypothetical protein